MRSTVRTRDKRDSSECRTRFVARRQRSILRLIALSHLLSCLRTMSFDLESLELHIRDILASPGTDLSTISAKGVRQKLTDVIPWLTPEVAREKKGEIDEVITAVYQAICAECAQDEEAASEEEAERTRKRNQGSDEEDSGQDDDEDEGPEAPRPAKRAKKEEDEDGKSKAKKSRGSTNGTAKKVGRPKKSAATVDSEAESEAGGSKKRGRKKSGAGEGGRPRGGFAKEYILR